MIKKASLYIHDLKDIRTQDDLDLVGRRSFDFSKFYNEDINKPFAFGVTSLSFDDYLISTGIADQIMKYLSDVQPFIRKTAQDASGQIANLILNTEVPDYMKNILAFAYEQLSKLGKTPVATMELSPIIPSKFLEDPMEAFGIVEIGNFDEFINQVRMAWVSLFSVKAIELRTNNYYNGPISTGLLIKSAVKSELSGRVYSIPPITREDNTIEIFAMYGMPNTLFDLESVGDSYKIDVGTMQIIQKNIIPQDFMVVRKGKVLTRENSTITVEISDEWQRKQKIDDKKILELASVMHRLESKYKRPLEVTWSIESGEYIVTDVRDQIIDTDALVKFENSKNSALNKLGVEVNPLPIEDSFKKTNPDLDRIEKEIQNLSDDKNLTSEDLNKQILISAKKQYSNGEYPKWMGDYDLKSEVYLDISSLNSLSISSVALFDGSYFDATNLVLGMGTLPELHTDDKHYLRSLMDSFAIEISTANKNTEGEKMIYRFSNMTDYEYKLLNIDSKEYTYIGDERFIEHPESLALEVQSIRNAKDEYNAKNISICFPYVRNAKNLENLKSIVTSAGLRRSASTKFYAEVAVPSFVHDIKNIEIGIIDGIIIDYDTLLKLTVYRSSIRKIDHEVLLKLLEDIKKTCKKMGLEIIIKVDQSNEEFMSKLQDLDPDAFIFNEIPKENFVKKMVEYEKVKKHSPVGLNTDLEHHS